MVAWPSTAAVREILGELYEPETRPKLVAGYVTALGAEKYLSTEKIEELAVLSTVEGLKGKKEVIKDLLGELYELEKRPKLVAEYATALGAEKVLSAEKIEELALLSTVDGLKGKKDEIKELAAPYIAKVYEADGRKELVAEATELASEKLIKPVREYTSEKVAAVKEAGQEYATEKVIKPASETVALAKELATEKAAAAKELYTEKAAAAKELATEKVAVAKELATEKVAVAKELAAPYVAKSSELAAPYIAKIESKRAEIVASKKYEKAMAAIQQVREHPSETASELKAKAIDLLKYDKIEQYRTYIQSEEFQADTLKLIKVELPAIAQDAAKRGVDKVKTAASSLASEIEAKRGQIVGAVERGYTAARKIELSDLKDKVKQLATELQGELSSGVEQLKTDGFSMTEALGRMKKVVVAIDAILISPLLLVDGESAEAPTEVGPGHFPSSGSPEAKDNEEEEEYADAKE